LGSGKIEGSQIGLKVVGSRVEAIGLNGYDVEVVSGTRSVQASQEGYFVEIERAALAVGG
jgi:hypothetical protein